MRHPRSHATAIRWIAAVVMAGCAAHGPIEPSGQDSDRPATEISDPGSVLDFWVQVKPIIDQRCVVCHACYDAPCQMKMSSIEGIERGASKAAVYDARRINAAPTTRLFDDAQSTSAWRNMGFHSVLRGPEIHDGARGDAGVMYRMLALKQSHPLPVDRRVQGFDLSLSSKPTCASPGEFDKYAADHPTWGMPYALPGLDETEHAVLTRWIEQGARNTPRPAIPDAFQSQIDRFEAFFNGPSLKQQLSSRYIFEHLSYAHLYFSALQERRFFELVRSASPPGEPIQIIATRRPYDRPRVARVYYRFREVVSTIVDKTHMPYALDDGRLDRWQQLFNDTDFEVSRLPGWTADRASNPFVTFRDIPVRSRYLFMLDEAQFSIMCFIKGPVCRGQIALDVIDDNFWIFFSDPDKLSGLDQLLAVEAQQLSLPASTPESYLFLYRWRQYRKQQERFLRDKDRLLVRTLAAPGAVSEELIWAGDGSNANASLTVFRHFDNATVEQGMLGPAPKTAWFVDYTLLERFHYLLVAGFDVFGNVGHQLDTRLYMDFLRMEAEANFLMLLPNQARVRERNHWYRKTDAELKSFVEHPEFERQVESGIEFQTDDPKTELYGILGTRLAPVQPERPGSEVPPATRLALNRLNVLKGAGLRFLPECAFLTIAGDSADVHVTLLRNQGHANISSLFHENKNRLDAENTLAAIVGFVGAYPNAFYVVSQDSLGRFVDAVSGLNSESDYSGLLDSYGVRRTDRDFWRHSDALHDASRNLTPVKHGVFDYSRLENR